MSVSFRQSYVSRPSVAPTSSTSGGTIQILHRRINQLNQRSETSPVRTGVTLPATLTPQSYSDTSALFRDEFLASNDSGATWKIVPRPSNGTGVLAIPAFDSGWTTTTLSSTQAATSFSLDFADFSPTNEPTQIVYMLNLGNSINSLTYNFLDLVTNSPARQYAGTIEVSILGTYPALGNNPDNSFNQSLLWNLPEVSLNTMSLLLPNLSYIKLQIKLLNFPLGSLASQSFNLALSVTTNQTKFTLTYPNQWPSGSFIIDDDSPFRLPLVTSSTNTALLVNPFQFNQNGILRSNLVQRSLVFSNGAKKLIYDVNGDTRVEPSSYSLASTDTLLATFTLQATAPYIVSLVYPWAIKPQSFIKVATSSALLAARFSTGLMAYATTAGSEVGVTLFTNSPLVATSGICWIELGGTVAAGDLLSPTTNGRAITGTGKLMALESGTSGSIIKAGFTLGAGTTGSSITTLVLPEQSSTPSTPASGNITLYARNDNFLYFVDDAGVNRRIPYTEIDINFQTGTTYTLALSDSYKTISLSNASAVTLTIPTNASVAFPIGTQIVLRQTGAGQVTVSPSGGVTLESKSSYAKLASQFSAGTLVKMATNTWWLFGDIAA